jgi:hypothetical protein
MSDETMKPRTDKQIIWLVVKIFLIVNGIIGGICFILGLLLSLMRIKFP